MSQGESSITTITIFPRKRSNIKLQYAVVFIKRCVILVKSRQATFLTIRFCFDFFLLVPVG